MQEEIMRASCCLVLLLSSIAVAENAKIATPNAAATRLTADKPSTPEATTAAAATAAATPPTKRRLIATQGRPGKPDRTTDAKRLIDAYQAMSVRYMDSLVRAQTPEEKAQVALKQPDPSTIFTMLAHMAATDPKDAAAFDALSVLVKFQGTPSIDSLLESVPGNGADGATVKIDPLALLLEHHANNPKLADVTDRLPFNPTVNQFLAELYEKSVDPVVRGRVGYRLAATYLNEGDNAAAEAIMTSMAEDRYLAGVLAGGRGRTAKEWAEGKLREINLVNIGKVIPEVSGENLEGTKESISDYRGNVVVLDVWATWCHPCVGMIPHEREMVKRLEGKNFVLLSASVDEEKETLSEFLKTTEMPWKHWWIGRDGDLVKSLNVTGFPTIIVLDEKGVIRYKNVRGEKLEEAVNELLRKSN